MAIRNGKLCVFLSIVSLLAALFIFSNSITAYAINENLIIDEYNGWIDAEVNHTYNVSDDGFDGVLKYIEDENNGCFYLYLRLYDTRVANGKDENIILTFTVENSISKYKFSVNRDGFINTGQNDINAVNLIYNFENCTCRSMGGEIFVGFELNNKADREQLNYIRCDYASGVDSVTTLFDDAQLDMYVEPTTKAATTKKASTTKKNKSTTTKKSTTGKSSDSKTTTKFKASGSITAGKSAKYSANSTVISDDNSTIAETITEQAAEKIVNSQELKMSKPAFSLMIAAFVMAGAGVAIVIIAVVSKEKSNQDNNDNDKDKDKETVQN